MRILWINHRCPKHPQAGGAEEYVFQISRRLIKKGHEVTLLAERPPGLPYKEEIDGIGIIRKGSFSTLHLWAPLYVARYSRSYDVIIDNIAHVFPFGSPWFTNRKVVAVVYHVNGSNLRRVLPPALRVFGEASEKNLPKIYRMFVTVSKSTKSELIKLGVDPSRVWVVYNGIDHILYRPGRRKSDTPTILWLNRFVKYKNPEHALKAFQIVKKNLPDAKLIMAGDGPERPRIESIARRLGIDNIIFTGRVSLAQKIKLLQESWVCLYTSDVEGWGLVALEAAACGTPCVGYAVGGLRESIVDGVTGFLARPGDFEDLADKILKIAGDVNTLKRLSQNAVAYASKFDWDRSVREFEEVLKIL